MNYAGSITKDSMINFIIKCDIEYARKNGLKLDVYREFYPQFFKSTE